MELVGTNVARRVKKPARNAEEKARLSLEEFTRLIAGSRDDKFGPLWMVLGTTGLRLSETLGLQWKNVDLDARVLHVKRSLQRQPGKGLVFTEPKSKSSRRTEPLTYLTVKALTVQRERLLFAKKYGIENRYDLVFPSEVGTGLEQGRVRKHLKATTRRLGLPATSPHQLRHTMASLLANQGENPRVVQELAGHFNIALTLGVYTHADEASKRAAMDRLNERIEAAFRTN